MSEYLEQKFKDIYRDISFKSKEECLGLVYTYLGRASEGSRKGIKIKTLSDLEARTTKGDQIVESAYRNPNISVEAKTAMDIITSTFIEYTNRIETLVDTWREKYLQEATKGLYELSRVYQGRGFNGEKSQSLESIESRYKRASQIILKHARKDLTREKLRAIKDLSKRFGEYEQRKASSGRYIDVLRSKNQEMLSMLERFAEYHKIIPKPVRKKQKRPQEQTKHVLDMPVGEAAKKVWNITKKVLFTKIF